MRPDHPLRRLPERWVVALATRDARALFTMFAIWTAIALVLARSSRSREWEELATAFGSFVVLEVFGQFSFSRRLRACDEEHAALSEGRFEAAPRGATPQGDSAKAPGRPRFGRNPRSAAFLASSDPSAQVASDLVAVLAMVAMALLFSRADSTLMLLTAAVLAMIAFERFGHHQALSRRRARNDVLRRKLERDLVTVPTRR